MRKSLKTRLNQKVLTIGSWITLAHPAMAEIMAKAGFDWLCVDMEHSAITLAEAQDLIRVIDLAGVVPLVRVGSNDSLLIKRAMDAGAHGVIVPMVNTREDALKAVQAVKYPPAGTRGVGLARAQGYGLEFDKYKQWVNKESIVIVQIEHIAAVNNLEEILTTIGVDGSMIGPYDLSASLGYPGQFDKKEVRAALKQYSSICRRLGKPAGFHVIPPEAKKVNEKVREGFRFVAFSLDTLFFGQKCRQEIRNLHR